MAHDNVNGVVQSQHGDSLQSVPLDFTDNTTVISSPVSIAIPMNGSRMIRIACSASCFILWGDSLVTATANDIFFPAGVEVLVVPNVNPPVTHLAIVQQLVAGVVSITPLGV